MSIRQTSLTQKGSLMGNFALKWEKFVHAMIDNGGYRNVLEGLRNTLLVALSSSAAVFLINLICTYLPL